MGQSIDSKRDLGAVTSQLSAAYMTDGGQLLCNACVARNRGQLARAGIELELVPCHGLLSCELCGHSVTDS